MAEPPWVTEGRKDLGFHEIQANQGIGKFIEQSHCGQEGEPWCAIWANAKLEVSGIRGTRSPSSFSFTTSQHFKRLEGPALGAIAVYHRVGGGHVGFYVGETLTQILTLGGNESDAVREQFEPKARFVGYFWPTDQNAGAPVMGKIDVQSRDGHPIGSET
jgi:uncharacterized protein (TIGR02594 family)